MRSLPTALEAEMTKTVQYGAYLLQIDLDTVLRFTSLEVSHRVAPSIAVGAQTWTPRRFQFGSVESAVSEEIEKMDLSIDNTDHSLTSVFHDEIIRRRLVWLWYCGLTYPATPIGCSLIFNGGIDQIEIDQSTIRFDVLSALSYWRRKVPNRIYQATCPWIYEALLSPTDPRYMKYCTHVPHEQCPDPTFSDPGAWTYANPPWSIHDGGAWKSAGILSNLSADCKANDTDKLTVVFTLSNLSGAGAGITPRIGGVDGTERTANGTYTETIIADEDEDLYFVPSSAATECKISAVSVKVAWCDQSYKHCSDIQNEDHFGGFRYLPYLINRTFKWGPEKM